MLLLLTSVLAWFSYFGLFLSVSCPSPHLQGLTCVFSHTSDPPPTHTLLPCCLWPSETKHFREREIILFEIWVEVVTRLRMRPWERIVVIASTACFLLLWFPLISLHVDWASHGHLRLPWEGILLFFLVAGEVLASQKAPLFLFLFWMSFVILEEMVEEHGYKNDEVILINVFFIWSGFTVLPAPVSWGVGLQASGISFWPDFLVCSFMYFPIT